MVAGLKAAALDGLMVAGLKAAALVGLWVAGLKAAALVGLFVAGLKPAALVGLMVAGLKAAALAVAAGPLPLAFELLRGSDSVCPVSEFALLCSIAQRRNRL